MQTINYSKAICMNISTYDDLTPKGEQLVFLLKKVFSLFFKYNSKKLIIEIEKVNGRCQTLKFDEKNLNKIFELIIRGQIMDVSIQDYQDRSGNETERISFPPDFSLSLITNHAATYPSNFLEKLIFPNGFGFSLNESLFGGTIPYLIQEQFMEIFKRFIVSMNGIMGYITYASTIAAAHGFTIFENYHRINHKIKPGYLEYVSGYHWMTLLNNRQIERLGGREYVKKNAPISSMEYLGQGAILQLTKDINDYSDDKLRDLRSFLLPLFPPGVGQSEPLSFDKGLITRLIE